MSTLNLISYGINNKAKRIVFAIQCLFMEIITKN